MTRSPHTRRQPIPTLPVPPRTRTPTTIPIPFETMRQVVEEKRQ